MGIEKGKTYSVGAAAPRPSRVRIAVIVGRCMLFYQGTHLKLLKYEFNGEPLLHEELTNLLYSSGITLLRYTLTWHLLPTRLFVLQP